MTQQYKYYCELFRKYQFFENADFRQFISDIYETYNIDLISIDKLHQLNRNYIEPVQIIDVHMTFQQLSAISKKCKLERCNFIEQTFIKNDLAHLLESSAIYVVANDTFYANSMNIEKVLFVGNNITNISVLSAFDVMPKVVIPNCQLNLDSSVNFAKNIKLNYVKSIQTEDYIAQYCDLPYNSYIHLKHQYINTLYITNLNKFIFSRKTYDELVEKTIDIAKNGLQTFINVVLYKNRLIVIHAYNRIEICQMLGLSSVPVCFIKFKHDIDHNIYDIDHSISNSCVLPYIGTFLQYA